MLICCKIGQQNNLIKLFSEQFPVNCRVGGTFSLQHLLKRFARKCSPLGISGKKSPLQFLCGFDSSLQDNGFCCFFVCFVFLFVCFLKCACLRSLPHFPQRPYLWGSTKFSVQTRTECFLSEQLYWKDYVLSS